MVVWSKIFGHLVFIYLVVWFRSNGPVLVQTQTLHQNRATCSTEAKYTDQIWKVETAKIQTRSSPVGFPMVRPVLEWSRPKKGSLTNKIAQKAIFKLIRVFQTSANQDHDSTIVDEASSTRLSPKPSQSQVIKLMLWMRVTQGRGEGQVESCKLNTCPYPSY